MGTAEKRKDYVDVALIEYTAAAYHFQEAGHIRYQACVENNLGFLFWKVNRFGDAHEHLDRAQILFSRLKDDLHGALVDETRARVLLSEGRLVNAQKAARRAVRTLEGGDEPSWLAEALIRLGVSLGRLRRFEDARSALERAIECAYQAGNVESAGNAALIMIEEIGPELSDADLLATLERAEMLLENAEDTATIWRLAKCAGRVAALIYASPRCFPSSVNWAEFSYDEEVDRYGKHLIELALKDAALVYSTYLGGSSRDQATGIAVDVSGHAYIVGGTTSANFPRTVDAFDITHNGGFDTFVLKVNNIA